MKIIHSYQVIYHGFEHSQYFSGCGSGMFENIITGCGSSPKEALNDALEMVAQSDNVNLDYIEENEKGKLPKDISTEEYLKSEGFLAENKELPEDNEIYYYVSIRWNTIEAMAPNQTS